MRVVSGTARGKTLQLVPGKGTRPILDRVKTALFDILRPRIQGIAMLDLFAGSGAVGIEALSQGAAHCTFTELGGDAIKIIKQNLATTGFASRAEVRQTDALAFLRTTRRSFDLIYVAPPQYRELWQESLRLIAAKPALLNPPRPDPDDPDEPFPSLVIAQIDPKEYVLLELDGLREVRERRYGNTLLVFYERVEATAIPGPVTGVEAAIEEE
jgi:16S rRNA (guanine(966)-N(2))-methyltransferase RsmD